MEAGRSKRIGEKHRRILGFIQDYQRKHKHPPSVAQIQEACAISSSAVVHYYLDQLMRSGHIGDDRRPE